LAADWRWLESTAELQEKTYEYPLKNMARGAEEGAPPQYAGPLAKYIMWNSFAATQELAEMNVEYSWKPWATDLPFINRQRILDEIIDVEHFLGNILVGMGVTDDEHEAAYKAKQDKNRRREASGVYSARKGGLGEGSEVG